MSAPDQRLFEADLATAEFRAGVAKGLWDLDRDFTAWPMACFWLKAAPRPNAPDRYYIRIDMTGYRSKPPTGRLFDPATKAWLDFGKYPKGKPNSRFARVFRTDWGESHRAFYHPYDRVAADSHTDWRQSMPQLVWTADHTIVDYLEEFQALLASGDYVGL